MNCSKVSVVEDGLVAAFNQRLLQTSLDQHTDRQLVAQLRDLEIENRNLKQTLDQLQRKIEEDATELEMAELDEDLLVGPSEPQGISTNYILDSLCQF